MEVALQGDSQGTKVPRVVIVGGGFGGLYTARGLAKAPVRVTLVDRRNYHLFRSAIGLYDRVIRESRVFGFQVLGVGCHVSECRFQYSESLLKPDIW